MAPRPKIRFWRRCRIYFRRFRIAVWLLILAVLAALLYVNQIGLPGFVKKPLLGRLHARGIDLQFSRLRLRWYQGIVAENVRFGRPEQTFSPRLSVAEVQVRLNAKALQHFQLQVDSLLLRRGGLAWPVPGTNQAPREITLTNIQTELRLLPNDQWALDHFTAGFAGAKIQLSGIVTNASAVRDWKLLHAERATPADLWQGRLRRFADTLEKIHCSAPPELKLDLRGDARDLRSFTVRLAVSAPGAETPWGTLARGHFTVRLFPTVSNELSHAELKLDAAEAQTPWAAITNLHLDLKLVSTEANTNVVKGRLRLDAEHAQTEWARATRAQFTAEWVHALTNPIPLAGQGRLRCDQAETRWGRGARLDLSGVLATPAAGTLPPRDPAWVWWTNLHPYVLDWELGLAELQTPKLEAQQVACAGHWGAPALTVTNLQARLYGGQLQAQAALNVATRALDARLTSDLDPHQVGPLLTEEARRWLAQISWPSPPRVNGSVSLVLPAWTNRQPDWRGEVQPTLSLQGEFNLDHGGAYRQVEVTSARAQVSYSNQVLHLDDLRLTRPEGLVAAAHRADERTHEYYWRLRSSVDPAALLPVLEPEQQKAFDLVKLTQAPWVEAEIWGRAHEPERIGVKGRVALTNFTFRGESVSGLQTAFQYTNRVLQIVEPRLQRGTQHLSADGVAADFNAQRVYLTNGFSTAEPMVIARAIGPHIARAIESYQFELPPAARVYGTIPMHGEEGADLHFELDGGPFHWWKFNVPHVVGHLHWLGERLTLKEVGADFYGGRAVGSALFNFFPKQDTEFQFTVTTTNTQLHLLMNDLVSRTNQLEGNLSGSLVVFKASTRDWRTVHGYGNLELSEGLIWSIPLFGVFSPVLDSLAPGLGSSRATAAACSFAITNGVVRSDDLEIRCSGVRLQYRGTVDLDSQLNARVEAELLRDMWLVGPVVSTVFWPVSKIFEYKVTGTLADPKTVPVYFIPRLVLLPFRPLRTIKDLFPETPSTRTNAPPSR